MSSHKLTHQVGRQSFLLVDGNLSNLSLLVDIASLDRLELQIPGHARMNQQLHKQSVSHQELWNEIDIPITATAELLSGVWLTELREELF